MVVFRDRYREWISARGYEGNTLEGYLTLGERIYDRFNIAHITDLDDLQECVWPNGAKKRAHADAPVVFKGKQFALSSNEATALGHVLEFERETRGRSAPKPRWLKSIDSAELDELAKLDLTDARERITTSIVIRRGGAKFRKTLIEAYASRCALTGCDVVDALEAAHIVPYFGPPSDRIDNGILLRADVHTLFDLGQISIDPDTLEVSCAARSQRTRYPQLARRLTPPAGVNRATLSENLRRRQAEYSAGREPPTR